jgi:cytochrome c oxidase assembly protein subunit 15
VEQQLWLIERMDSSPSSVLRRPSSAVRLWLLTVAALIFVTLVVGGATRLTDSGLSIVEWKPVTGILPPMDERVASRVRQI